MPAISPSTRISANRQHRRGNQNQPIQVSSLFKMCSTAAHHYKRQNQLGNITEVAFMTDEDGSGSINVIFGDTMDVWKWAPNDNYGNPMPNNPDMQDDRYNTWQIAESNVSVDEETDD